MLRATVVFLALAIQASPTLATSGGPPGSACGTRTPDHGVPPQTTDAPYELDVQYHDDHYDVGIFADPVPFLGFMMQAIDENGDIVGRFAPKDSNAKLMSCDNSEDSISHSNPSPKPSIHVEFYLPEGVAANGIVIRASVVQNYVVFWTNMESVDLGEVEPGY